MGHPLERAGSTREIVQHQRWMGARPGSWNKFLHLSFAGNVRSHSERRAAAHGTRKPPLPQGAFLVVCVCVPVCLSAANKEQEVQRQYNEKFRNYKNPRAKEMH
jgi:hypothetical protein